MDIWTTAHEICQYGRTQLPIIDRRGKYTGQFDHAIKYCEEQLSGPSSSLCGVMISRKIHMPSPLLKVLSGQYPACVKSKASSRPLQGGWTRPQHCKEPQNAVRNSTSNRHAQRTRTSPTQKGTPIAHLWLSFSNISRGTRSAWQPSESLLRTVVGHLQPLSSNRRRHTYLTVPRRKIFNRGMGTWMVKNTIYHCSVSKTSHGTAACRLQLVCNCVAKLSCQDRHESGWLL